MSVYDEITAERARQDAQWGQAHDDAARVSHFERLIPAYVGKAFETRMQTGNHDMTDWRRRMVQVAALAVAAIETEDRYQRRAESRP